jgi:hypothetical protein
MSTRAKEARTIATRSVYTNIKRFQDSFQSSLGNDHLLLALIEVFENFILSSTRIVFLFRIRQETKENW